VLRATLGFRFKMEFDIGAHLTPRIPRLRNGKSGFLVWKTKIS